MRADDLFIPEHVSSPMAEVVWGVMRMSHARKNAVWCRPCSKWFRCDSQHVNKSVTKLHSHCVQAHYTGEDGVIYSKRPRRPKRKEDTTVTDSSPDPATQVASAVAESLTKSSPSNNLTSNTPTSTHPAAPAAHSQPQLIKEQLAQKPPTPMDTETPPPSTEPNASNSSTAPLPRVEVATPSKSPETSPVTTTTTTTITTPPPPTTAPKPGVVAAPSPSIESSKEVSVTPNNAAPDTVEATTVTPMDTTDSPAAASNDEEQAASTEAMYWRPSASTRAALDKLIPHKSLPAPPNYKERLAKANRAEMVRKRGGYRLCPVEKKARDVAERAQEMLFASQNILFLDAIFIMPSGEADALEVIGNGADYDDKNANTGSWLYHQCWAHLFFFQQEMASLGLRFQNCTVRRVAGTKAPPPVEDWCQIWQQVPKKKKKKSKAKKQSSRGTDEPAKKKQKSAEASQSTPTPDKQSMVGNDEAVKKAKVGSTSPPMSEEARQAAVDALEDEPPITPERPAASNTAMTGAGSITAEKTDASNGDSAAAGSAEGSGSTRTQTGMKRKSNGTLEKTGKKARIACDEVIDLT